MGGQFCTFWLDEHLLGLPIGTVREVLPAQPVTPVPLAPPGVPGLLNLRGQIVTVVDLRARLGLPAQTGDEDSGGVHVIVAGPDGAQTSLFADRVGEVLTPERRRFAAPPQTMDGHVRSLVTSVCTLDEHLMLVLDIESTIAVGGAS
jgi:purine-binding chemotaxis protein CheW